MVLETGAYTLLMEIKVTISQREEDIFLLKKYARKVPADQTIIDIGTLYGGTAVLFFHFSPARIITIGPPRDDARRENIFEKTKANLTECCDSRLLWYVCLSQKYVHDGSPVGLVLVDGDHSEEGVRYDIENFGPLIVPGGYLLLHDYNKPKKYPHIMEWAQKLCASGEYSLLEVGELLAVLQKRE